MKMNNRYINGMNDITADDCLKLKIVNSVKHNNQKQTAHFFTLKKAAAVIVIACAITLVMTFGLPYLQSGNNTVKQEQTGVTALFSGFVVTAYAEDGTPFEVKPQVDFLLGKYQMTMSSAPGFPLKIVCNDADTIKLTATNGEFLLWAPPDGQIRKNGNELEMKPGETVYWTPLTGADSVTVADSCTVSIKAYKDNRELGINSIRIESDNNYSYTGRLLE